MLWRDNIPHCYLSEPNSNVTPADRCQGVKRIEFDKINSTRCVPISTTTSGILLEVLLILPGDPLTPGQIQLPIRNIGDPPILDRSLMILTIFRRRLGEWWRDYNILNRDESHGASLGALTSPK